MFEKWYNIKDKQPELVHVNKNDGEKFSDQILLLVNDKLYIGVYVLYSENYSLELASYGLCSLEEKYNFVEDEEVIYSDHFDEYEIFWSKIDIIELLMYKDLCKGENKNETKSRRTVKNKGD